MKTINVVIPCYNEEENIEPMIVAVKNEFEKLDRYDYNIIFIDNYSEDKTREILEKICKTDNKIKAIFNTRNFGPLNSTYYGIMQSDADATVLMAADFQEPPEMISKFIAEWENGYKIVIGIKSKSKESKIKYCLRSLYYKIIKKMSNDVALIEQFTGFGLYDKVFIKELRKLDDSTPFFRGIVAELGFKRKEIEYVQEKRKNGKTKHGLFLLYDLAMLSFTSYTKFGLRFATFLGIITSMISFLIGFIYLILKLVYWDRFIAGTAPVLIGTFFLGSLQLFFIGFLGEYIMAINERVKHRPLVIEEKRLNFEKKD